MATTTAHTAPFDTSKPLRFVAALATAALGFVPWAEIAAQSSTPPSADEAKAADAIDEPSMRAVVAEIASDRYAGRAPGTDGDEMTLAYLERALAELGFEAGGPSGAWRQEFELVGVTARQPSTWTFERGGDSVDLAQRTDFIAASGVQQARAAVEDAEVVFVGYGIEAPEHDWNDFKGADLEGKVLLMLNNDPDFDPELFGGRERLYYGRWTYKY
jgi:hypothetical protein